MVVTRTPLAETVPTGKNTMMRATAKFTAQERPRESRKLGGSWKYWLVLAAVALIAGLAFNWSWLVAAGAAPLVLSILPCLAMCALRLHF